MSLSHFLTLTSIENIKKAFQQFFLNHYSAND